MTGVGREEQDQRAETWTPSASATQWYAGIQNPTLAIRGHVGMGMDAPASEQAEGFPWTRKLANWQGCPPSVVILSCGARVVSR